MEVDMGDIAARGVWSIRQHPLQWKDLRTQLLAGVWIAVKKNVAIACGSPNSREMPSERERLVSSLALKEEQMAPKGLVGTGGKAPATPPKYRQPRQSTGGEQVCTGLARTEGSHLTWIPGRVGRIIPKKAFARDGSCSP